MVSLYLILLISSQCCWYEIVSPDSVDIIAMLLYDIVSTDIVDIITMLLYDIVSPGIVDIITILLVSMLVSFHVILLIS